MRLSILPKWLMLFATIVLSCTLRAGGEESLKGGEGTRASASYLSEI